MKNSKLLLLFFIWFSNYLNAQIKYDCKVILEIETDEDFFSDQSIFGNGNNKKYRNRIIHQEFSGTDYRLLVGTKSFEKGNPLCNSQIIEDTLKVEFRVKGEIDESGFESVEIGQSKYREVQINFENINQKPKIVLLNGKQIIISKEKFLTFPERHELLGGDTINRIDKFGQKQGTWIEGTAYNKIESLYNNSKLIKGTMSDYSYNGKLKSEYFFLPNYDDGQVYFRSYFDTGKIQEENYRIGRIGKFKKKWHSNGNLYQENFYNGKQIEITQYKENGVLDCKCETQVGVESFKGMIICWTTNNFKILCTYYDENGEAIDKTDKEFKLNYEINPRL